VFRYKGEKKKRVSRVQGHELFVGKHQMPSMIGAHIMRIELAYEDDLPIKGSVFGGSSDQSPLSRGDKRGHVRMRVLNALQRSAAVVAHLVSFAFHRHRHF
jgi:hypothetical protein